MSEDKFTVGIAGLSKDMEDFMCEQADYYLDNYHKFYTSFWELCVNIWSNGVDLSDKQLDIIEGEYNKVKKERMNEPK